MGYPQEAEKLYTEAHGIFVDMKNNQGRAWSQLGLATVYRAQCRFSEAATAIKSAQELFQSLDMKDRVGWCLLHDAAIKRTLGKTDEALAVNKKAMQLFGPLKNNDGVSWSLFQTARILKDRGQLVKAWQMFRDVVNLQTDIANKKGIGWAQNDLGEIYLEFDDTSHARDCLIKAKVVGDQLDNAAMKTEAQKNLARLFIDEGHLRKAASYLDEVDVLCQKGLAHETQVEAFFERARYFLSLTEHKKAREQVTAAASLIELYGLGRFSSILKIYKSEIAAAEKKEKNAADLLENVLADSRKSKLKSEEVSATIGIIQLLMYNKKNKNKVIPMLAAIEKDIRILSARRLKAKLAMLKGLVSFYTMGVFQPKSFDQAIQIAETTGLQVLEKQFVDVAIQVSAAAGDVREQAAFQKHLDGLMVREEASDLYLVKPAKETITPFQISLVI
jgi:tetratricopeptide (TPR) repeat protein